MWVEFMSVANGYVAETWQELFAAEGLRIVIMPPVGRGEDASMRDERTIYVPTGKAHVAREILRKI
ncbi:MAG: hypothetical protein F4Y92_01545 [Dehalococcoidia bacterium]|nr:hypothetical protein [Dehalococcoidia bacterium]MYI85909.1 hypothetical protein [Dehalococcoidia bacterium]